MAVLFLNGKRLKRMIHASTKWLLANEKVLNDINVFPVPDGDTGTNMGLTLKNIVKSISDAEMGDHLPHVASNVATAALLGARGNSGVILSQIFKGFSEGIGNKKKLNSLDIAYALKKAYEKAYNAISNPIEGTILTVVRDGVNFAYEKAKTEADIIIVIEALLKELKRSLMNTPNLLPILKESGVVDAGAMGFVYIIEGVHMLLTGEEFPEIDIHSDVMKKGKILIGEFFGYCNEFFINGDDLDIDKIRDKLTPLGDSLVLAQADNMLKIHIHSKHPGYIIEECLKHGILTDIKIENMDAQHSEVKRESIKKETVIISIALGEGVKKIFESLGCDFVIKGGQTMNPSVEELNDAVNRFDAQNYILLPNNGNVIFTAEQIKGLNEDKNITIIPTRSVPEGFATLLAYNHEFSIDENIHNMNLSIKAVKTGEITKAVKDTSMNGLKIRKNDIIALYNNTIISTFSDTDTAVIDLIDSMIDEEDELISLFYGEDIEEQQAKKNESRLKKLYNNVEVEVHHGGQPHYSYIISIE
ncbi:MAG: DAK2 domain-containing protein [Spirochaetes bacterium]|nr:DAK2 domain-containing protein [Spirochaetota bacterium]